MNSRVTALLSWGAKFHKELKTACCKDPDHFYKRDWNKRKNHQATHLLLSRISVTLCRWLKEGCTKMGLGTKMVRKWIPLPLKIIPANHTGLILYNLRETHVYWPTKGGCQGSS